MMNTKERANGVAKTTGVENCASYGCHIRVKGSEKWVRVLFDTEADLDAAIATFEATGLEVA